MLKFSETRRKINEYCQNSGKYPPDAYEFVTDCVIKQVNSQAAPRHLTALELLQGISEQLEKEFSSTVIEALKLLTHDESVEYMDYIRNIKDNPIATAPTVAAKLVTFLQYPSSLYICFAFVDTTNK